MIWIWTIKVNNWITSFYNKQDSQEEQLLDEKQSKELIKILSGFQEDINQLNVAITSNQTQNIVLKKEYLEDLAEELLNLIPAVSEQIQILKTALPKPESPKPRLEIQTKKVDQKALESPESPIPSSPVSPRLFSEPDSDSESITARLGEHSLKALNPLLISDAIERIDSDSIVSGRDIIQKLKNKGWRKILQQLKFKK
jgi:hypothetical protein